MRRAGGYGQLICFEDHAATAKDSFGRVIGKEHDSFSCKHCNRVVFVNAREKAEDLGGFCKVCTGLICGPCVGKGCDVLEEKLRRAEAKQDARRSYGF